MEWSRDQHNIWRAVLLGGLLIALLGPWVFTSDGLPPPEFCQAPNRIINERCVRLMSGMEIFRFMFGGLWGILLDLVAGTTTLSGRGREFLLIALFVMPALPFITTPLLLKRESKGLRILHTLAWGIVTFLCLFILRLDDTSRSLDLWGLWLCLAASVGALLLETAAWFSQRGRRESSA